MLIDLGSLTFDSAKELAGTTFTVELPDGRATSLRLRDVQIYDVHQPKNVRHAPKRKPFSMFFSGDPSVVLPQQIYKLSSDASTFEQLFLVPIGRDESATHYEAIFT
jgi:uncharacterized protein DUF6916